MSRPVARPGVSEVSGAKPALGAGSRRISPPKDLASARSSYITAEQVFHVSREMTDRDWQVLTFVSGCRLASSRQLIRRYWQTNDREASQARAGRRALKRLADWRVLDPLPRRVGSRRAGSESIVYGVGRLGRRLLAARGQTGPRLEAPGALYVAHTLAATELVVTLHEADRDRVLELIEIQSEPACWRSFPGAAAARLTLKPDLYVRVGAGADSEDRWMIEVDLATEASGTIRAKATRHIAYYRSAAEPVHPRVLWAVPDHRRAEQIADVLHRLPDIARRLFSVCLHDEVAAFLASEARS
ncbi:MAG TPA: replication-relaxation family protein [Solirubrobacteraceae bacterium]|nr:replication-relaxation family protein [Solirubrobacteraceae bacterium]